MHPTIPTTTAVAATYVKLIKLLMGNQNIFFMGAVKIFSSRRGGRGSAVSGGALRNLAGRSAALTHTRTQAGEIVKSFMKS